MVVKRINFSKCKHYLLNRGLKRKNTNKESGRNNINFYLNVIDTTHSVERVSSQRKFRTRSLQEGLKLLYPDIPWLI